MIHTPDRESRGWGPSLPQLFQWDTGQVTWGPVLQSDEHSGQGPGKLWVKANRTTHILKVKHKYYAGSGPRCSEP